MKQSFRFSLAGMFVACGVAAAFIWVNLIQRDIGSGVHLLKQGWPFLAVTTHSLNGITVHWTGVLANVFSGIVLSGVATMMASKRPPKH